MGPFAIALIVAAVLEAGRRLYPVVVAERARMRSEAAEIAAMKVSAIEAVTTAVRSAPSR